MPTSPNRVQSVAKAIELLNCLADAKRPLSLQEISLRTGWAKSTVHGLLSTMREFSIVEQSVMDGKYKLGIRLFELGNIVSSTWDIIVAAKPHLQNIALQTGESVHIAMIDKGEILYLDYIDAGSSLRVVAPAGTRLPVHCSAMGKAIISFLPEYDALKILQTSGLKAFTPHTIVSMDAMREEMRTTRERGYAIENGEVRVGMRSVAAPIFDASKKPAYSIGVTGMFRNITDEIFVLSEKLIVEAAMFISRDLGYRE